MPYKLKKSILKNTMYMYDIHNAHTETINYIQLNKVIMNNRVTFGILINLETFYDINK